jgi:phosphoglycolate phosphatase
MLRILRPFPAESIRLIVFDLDGTLIDSRQDLCNSVNATLENFDLAPLPDEVIAGFIGDGAAMLIRRALSIPGEVPAGFHGKAQPLDEELFAEAFQYFLTYYRAHKLDYTRVYPGVIESLEALKQMPDGSARPMAVLTNKPVGPARAICDGLGLSPYFFSVYGGDSFSSKKPDPLGDSDVDMKTARNAGVWAVGCSFGLAPETLGLAAPDAIVDHAAEWALAMNSVEIRN